MDGGKTYFLVKTGKSAAFSIPANKITATGKYSIYIYAVDKSGNKSTSRKVGDYYYDGDAPKLVLKSVLPKTSTTSYSNCREPKVSWNYEERSFKSVALYINGKLYKNFTAKAGSCIIPSSYFEKTGIYSITGKATDASGNVSPVIETLGDYYYDADRPILKSASLGTETSADEYSSFRTPEITWSYDEMKMLSVYLSVNGCEYKKIGIANEGTYSIPSNCFTDEGIYEIKLKAVDTANNVTESIVDNYYFYPGVSDVADYFPNHLTLEQQSGYKTKIYWSLKDGVSPNSYVYYNIYRGETSEFIPSRDNLIAEKVYHNYWYDISINETKTYYYKIQAVAIDEKKEVVESGNYTEAVKANPKAIGSFERYLGENSKYSYLEVSAPMGCASVERGLGNLFYRQSDVTIPNSEINFSLTRIYNSMSSYIGSLGNGWDFSFNMQLMQRETSDSLWLKDDSGALIEFVHNNNIYTQKQGRDYQLKKEEGDLISFEQDEQAVSMAIAYTYILQDKNSIKYYFDRNGQIVFILSANKHYLQFNYGQSGLLSSITSETGKSVNFSYNGCFVDNVLLPDNTRLVYQYNGNELIKVIYEAYHTKESDCVEDYNSISYEYGYETKTGLLNCIIDAEGNAYKIQYDNSKVSRVTYPNEDYYKLTYTENGSSLVKCTFDNRTLYTESCETDSQTGFVIKNVNALGKKTIYRYNNYNLAQEISDTSYETIEYNEETKRKEVVNKKGTKTINYQYEDGNVIKESDSDGLVTNYTYEEGFTDNISTIKTYIDGCEETLIENTAYSYDENGNTIKTEDKINHTVEEKVYTEAGNGEEVLIRTYNNGVLTTTETEEYNEDGILISSDQTIGTKVTLNGEEDSEEEETGEEANSDLVYVEKTDEYNSLGLVVRTTDEKNQITEYKYDFLGRETEVKYINGDSVLVEKKSYYPNGQVKSETRKDGKVTSYQYDTMNRLIAKAISDGEKAYTWTTSYAYEDIEIYTGQGNEKETVSSTYVTKEINPDGKVTSMSYVNGMGQVVLEKKGGLFTSYNYDDSGNAVVSFEIGKVLDDISQGLVSLSLYDENGKATCLIKNPGYDQENKVYYIDNANSIVNFSEYDDKGNLITAKDGEENILSFQYDSASRLSQVTLPDQTTQSYQYDIMDEEGNVTVRTINALNNISEETVDGEGKLIATTDINTEGKNIVVKKEYDVESNQEKDIYSNGSYIIYYFDMLGRLEYSESYDSDDLLKQITRYQYDKMDNIIAMCDYSVDDNTEKPLRYTGYEYDLLGRVTGYYEIDGTDAPTKSEIALSKIVNTYNAEGNILTEEYANNSNVLSLNYSYTSEEWLDEITATVMKNGVKCEEPVRSYTYFNDGNIESMKEYTDILGDSGNYQVQSFTYDVFGRIETVTYETSGIGEVETYKYSYNKNSNIISKEVNYSYPNLTVSENRKYSYDSRGQLVQSILIDDAGSESTIDYSYDAAGNMTKLVDEKNASTSTYTYNQLNQLVASVTVDNKSQETISDMTYEYDDNGNQLSYMDSVTGESASYEYNVQNNLIRVSGERADGTSYMQENRYNGSGERIYKKDTVVNEITTEDVTCEVSVDSDVTEDETEVTTGEDEVTLTKSEDVTKYYYHNGSVLYTTDEMGILKTFNYYDASGNLIGSTRYKNEVSYYTYNTDVQGSTTNIIDSTLKSCIGYIYDDFGTPTVYTQEDDFENEITYTGAIYDSTTGLYYMNARYYDSETGRFLAQDTNRGTKEDEGTWNLYIYCANDPINYTDPDGHSKVGNKVKKAGKKIKKAAKKAVSSIKKGINNGIKKAKKYANKSLKWMTKVSNFALILDLAMTCFCGYRSFKGTIDGARKAKSIITNGKDMYEAGRSGKVKEEFFYNEVVPFATKYVNDASWGRRLKSLGTGIFNMIGRVINLSAGNIVANCIDYVDNYKNNGYVFTKY